MNLKVIVPTIAIITAAGLGAWYYSANNSDQQVSESKDAELIDVPEIVEPPTPKNMIQRTAEPINEEPTSEVTEEAEPELPPLPEIPKNLMESDTGFTEAAKNLSAKLAAWMTPDHQIRKWVFVIDNIADNKFPVQNQPLDYKIEPFKVQGSEGDETFYVSKENFNRADALINSITSIPANELVRYYQHWLPLLNNAYDELGRGDSFEDRLLQAIDNILAIEPLTEQAALKRPSVFYVYADKDLEKADKLSKLFWRLGPDNTKKVQAYLRTLEPLINQ